MSTRHDFSKTLFHPSSLGALYTRTRDKKGMGEKAIKELVKIYGQEKYGKRTEIKGKAIQKGKLGEPEAIRMLGYQLDIPLIKNTERIENSYLSGEVDAFVGTDVRHALETFDTKCSYTIESYFINIINGLKDEWELQGHGYMALTGAKKATTVPCLISMPDSMINDEKIRLAYKMDAVTTANPEYEEKAAELELNMIFDDIPAEERFLLFPVNRDESKIIEIYSRCVEWREWLSWFQDKHLGFNKKIISIP